MSLTDSASRNAKPQLPRDHKLPLKTNPAAHLSKMHVSPKVKHHASNRLLTLWIGLIYWVIAYIGIALRHPQNR